MTADIKHRALAFLALAAIATILLASALPQLELSPGIPLPQRESGPGIVSVESPLLVPLSANRLLIAILVLVVGAFLLYGAVRLSQGLSWRKILREALNYSPLLAIPLVLALISFLSFGPIPVTTSPSPPDLPTPTPSTSGPPLGLPPETLIWFVWIGLGALFLLAAIGIIGRSLRQAQTNDPVKLEAERAVNGLRTGLDLRSVIIRCYEQMSAALQREEGIELEETMTAREFEHLLQARGIPNDPIHELTQLFEVARYTHRALGRDSEEKALSCLDAIVKYSRGRKQAD